MKTNAVLLSSLALGALGMVAINSPVAKADTTPTEVTANSNNALDLSSPTAIQQTKALIAPVANQDNQSLAQIAAANNVDIETMEKLNNNVDLNQPLADGTPIYLPQNEQLSPLFVNLLTARSGLTAAQYQKYYGDLSPAERSAKEWIAYRESKYSYHAKNGKFIGRFQLTDSYLHGDYSVDNQERTADRYVANRYGSWVNAKKHWVAHTWY